LFTSETGDAIGFRQQLSMTIPRKT